MASWIHMASLAATWIPRAPALFPTPPNGPHSRPAGTCRSAPRNMRRLRSIIPQNCATLPRPRASAEKSSSHPRLSARTSPPDSSRPMQFPLDGRCPIAENTARAAVLYAGAGDPCKTISERISMRRGERWRGCVGLALCFGLRAAEGPAGGASSPAAEVRRLLDAAEEPANVSRAIGLLEAIPKQATTADVLALLAEAH